MWATFAHLLHRRHALDDEEDDLDEDDKDGENEYEEEDD